MLDIRDHGGTFGGFGGKNIKSIQRGSIQLGSSATNQNIPITPVDASKSIIRISYYPSGYSGATAAVSATLSNTAVTLTRFSGSQPLFQTIYWEVIEFENVKSKQTGNDNGNGGVLKTRTISAVNVSKSLIFHSQISTSTNAAGLTGENYSSGLSLANSTTLNIIGLSSSYIDWQIIEFK